MLKKIRKNKLKRRKNYYITIKYNAPAIFKFYKKNNNNEEEIIRLLSSTLLKPSSNIFQFFKIKRIMLPK